jgi:hypothetical protein
MDDLLRFLPGFERPGREYVKGWVGGRTEQGSLRFPYPVYEDDVLEFFMLAGKACWSDFGYNPREAAQMLEREDFIEDCSLDEIRTMLTFCVRGERFGDGHWEQMLKSGKISRILRRLMALRETVEP